MPQSGTALTKVYTKYPDMNANLAFVNGTITNGMFFNLSNTTTTTKNHKATTTLTFVAVWCFLQWATYPTPHAFKITRVL